MKATLKTFIVSSLAVIAACAHSESAQLAGASADPGPGEQSAASSQDTDDGWPRTLSSGSDQITIYQPQIESWDGNALRGRAAVSVQIAASSQPVYGVVWFSARTEVDKENHLVTLEDVQLTKTSFPSQPDRAAQYGEVIGPQLSSGIQTIALDRLEASLAVTQAEQKQATVAVKNTPPRVLYSATPALLILIDGDPVLRKVEGTNLLRVINTRSLILLDSSSGTYYLFLANRWMQARAATGPWTQAQNPPQSLETAKQTAAKDKLVDLLDAPNSPVVTELQRGVVPTIYVSTTPAELIQTDGKPQLEPISGTQLLEVNNSSSTDLFVNEADQQYYALLSGRWYRSSSLENGPWSFVSADKLPADFSQIPENHPKGAVLASVSGTAQAQEAAIANQIPQTAAVNRSQAQLTVQYDGTPQFKPVCETTLTYAVNTATPVVQIGPTAYYAVSSGVWFTAPSPNGPWAVASFVPQQIYSIRPCSPVYNVTHVYVYGATPEVVYAGYTPGYLGSFIAPEGVVVFGTGYVYPPWIGTVWVGAPATFGFDVGWSAGFGWGFGGFGFGLGVGLFHPWWGPYGWGWGHRNIVVNNIHYTNIYRSSWHRNVVNNNHWDRHAAANRGPMSHGQGRPNSVYAGRDGHAYRNSGSNWQRYGQGGWHRAPGASAPQARPPSSPSPASHGSNELGRESFARNQGASHWNAFRGGGGFHGGFRGGGFGGGGRRR